MKLSAISIQTIILPWILICLNSCQSCNSEKFEPELPPYTESGANTFGCRIDGEIYVPRIPLGSMLTPLKCFYQIVNDTPYFSLVAARKDPDRAIYINIDRLPLNKDTVLHFANIENRLVLGRVLDDRGTFTTGNNASGVLEIKHLDFQNQNISGVFSFDAKNEGTAQEIKVTDGRFDVHFTR